MIEVTAESHSRSSNYILVVLQHVSWYGKTRRSGTAWTVRHASNLEYGQNCQRRVFARCNGGHTTTHQETSRPSPRREEAACCISRAYQGECCDRKTPGNVLWPSNGQLSYLRIWHSKESTDSPEVHWHRCTSTTIGTTKARNTTRATCWQGENLKLRNRRFATWISIYTYSASQRSIFQSWSILQESHAQ